MGSGVRLVKSLDTEASEDLAARVGAHLAPSVGALDFSGWVILARGGQIRLSTGYGAADREFDVPHTPDTRYWVGSIAKLFTRRAVVALEQAGALHGEDTLDRFLPTFPNARGISVNQLLDHRAGLARDLILGGAAAQPHTTEQIVDLVAELPPVSAPGEREAYSNNGYRVLARVLEIAAGSDHVEIVRETVLAPLGMTDTLQADLLDVVPRLAPGYVPGSGFGTLRHATPYNVVNEPGAGSFYSTPRDLLTFCRSLTDQDDPGALASDAEPVRRIGHNGLGNGYVAYCDRYPDHDAEVVMLGNVESGLFGSLRDDLRDLLFGEPVAVAQPSRLEAEFEPDAARLLQGTYELAPGGPTLDVNMVQGRLEVDAGNGAHPLVPMGENRYFMRLKYAAIEFDASGSTMTWTQDGTTFTLPRLR